MAVYDNRQMNKMRQDAIRRSQEMHKRSFMNAGPHYSEGRQRKADIPPEEPKKAEDINKNDSIETMKPLHNSFKKSESQFKEMLGKLFDGKIDSDKLIIIALMILLYKEGADIKLILALGYILI